MSDSIAPLSLTVDPFLCDRGKGKEKQGRKI
jgi:hypothetical protein